MAILGSLHQQWCNLRICYRRHWRIPLGHEASLSDLLVPLLHADLQRPPAAAPVFAVIGSELTLSRRRSAQFSLRIGMVCFKVMFFPRRKRIQRCTHGMSQMRVRVRYYCSRGGSAFSQRPADAQPPTHDPFAGYSGLFGLRMVGVFHSAGVAGRWLVASTASSTARQFAELPLECNRDCLLVRDFTGRDFRRDPP
jgi:hypothetical protein